MMSLFAVHLNVYRVFYYLLTHHYMMMLLCNYENDTASKYRKDRMSSPRSRLSQAPCQLYLRMTTYHVMSPKKS